MKSVFFSDAFLVPVQDRVLNGFALIPLAILRSLSAGFMLY